LHDRGAFYLAWKFSSRGGTTKTLEREYDLEPVVQLHTFDTPILKHEVAKAISSLVKRNAAPPRGVHNSTIKAVVECLIEPLITLFHNMVSEIWTPPEWREEKLILLFKTGSNLLLDNFQGISIRNCLGKVFRKIIAKRLIRAAEEANIWGDIHGSGCPGPQ